MKPGNGRKTEAPCGHPGEVVIGTFVRCLRGCVDDAPEDEPDEETLDGDECPLCGSDNVQVFPAMFASGDDLGFCHDCKGNFIP